MNLHPNSGELRALSLFVSTDETRVHLNSLWHYASDGGATYLATDGHTLAARFSGTHRTMKRYEIAKLEAVIIDDEGKPCPTPTKAPGWQDLVQPSSRGKLADWYGFNPMYIARIGEVEKAAGHRAAADFTPPPNMSIKYARSKRTELKTTTCACWAIPADTTDPWFWRLDTAAALWEGVVMPRRL